MKPQIVIEESTPGSFTMKCSGIPDNFTVISILLEIAKAVAGQMKKEESPIAKPQLVL